MIPGSQLRVFDRAGHFPQLDNPQRFADTVLEFTSSTKPARVDARRWAKILREQPSALSR
jgi:hypothetical protein